MDSRPVVVVRYAADNAFADFRAIYTWRVWMFGWLGRMLAQVTFFTLIAHAFGAQAQVGFLAIGNAVMTAVIEAMMVVASSSWERAWGTLPLLAAAPSPLILVYFGRSLHWPFSGAGTSIVALFGLAPFFGVGWRPAQVAPVVGVVLLTALGTYCFGLFLAALLLRVSGFHNLASNVAYLVMMAICGVQVPVDFWPRWVGAVAMLLPPTHGIAAIRRIEAEESIPAVLLAVGLTALTATGWLLAASVAFHVALIRSRRAGTIDFAS